MHKLALSAILALSTIAACKSHGDANPPAADNTAQNKRDRQTTPTADNTNNNSADVDLTQKIRKAVEADSSLSTTAHNCKIVVQDGTVTLVGPVKSADESTRVAQIATGVAGDRKVINQLEVTN